MAEMMKFFPNMFKAKRLKTGETIEFIGIKGDKGDKGDPGKDATPYDDTEIREEVDSVKADLSQKVDKTQVATTSNTGLVKANNNYGIGANPDGTLYVAGNSQAGIDSRDSWVYSPYKAITGNTLDYAVKQAMCDGKGAEWTDTEKANARARMGLGNTYELIEDIILSEDVPNIQRSAEPNGTPYNFKAIYIWFNLKPATNISSVSFIGNYKTLFNFYGAIKAEQVYGYLDSEISNGMIRTFAPATLYSFENATASVQRANLNPANLFNNSNFNNLIITATKVSGEGNGYIPAGSNIKIYGLRA